MKGVICSFDREDGSGLLRDVEGKLRWFYACNVAGRMTLFAETASVYFEEGDHVEFHFDSGFTVVDTRGKFDELKWAHLTRDGGKLPFTCDESGNAVNGLFGN